MGAFVGVGDGEEVGFFPRLADELGADREAALRETTRDADRGEAGEVYADRINIAEVKRERIGFLADLKRGHRRGGRQERIDVAEGVKKILPDERTHFLRAKIIGVVVTGAKHVGAEDNPALHLGAETLGARVGVDVDGVFRGRRAVTVTNAVVAAEV